MTVWYAGYGSNLERTRFLRYLEGGAAPGASRTLTGARDPSPPRDERAFAFAGTMFFGWDSPTWHGGISFVEVPDGPGRTADASGTVLARAYLLSEEQLADVAHQEMHREPGDDLDLGELLRLGPGSRHTYGPGRYETLHLLGELDGHPVLTFTAGHRDHVPLNEPTADYLTILARGLRETHGLGDAAVVDYLLARPGIGSWDAAGLRALLG